MLFFQKKSAELDNITIIIKTFQRPKTVNGAIKTIRRFYPDINILVADDSKEPTIIEDQKTKVFRLPFDTGVSKGRNFLVSQVETDYVLSMDDDHFFNRSTNIEKMLVILKKYDFDILSCLVMERSKRKKEFYRKKVVDFYLNMELQDGVLKFVDGHYDQTREYTTCDLVHQFFVAKTDSIRSIDGWDEQLKTADHADFFLRAKFAELKVGYTPLVQVDHVHLKEERFSTDYTAFRCRMPEFRRIWIEKHMINKIVQRDGSVVSAQDFINASQW